MQPAVIGPPLSHTGPIASGSEALEETDAFLQVEQFVGMKLQLVPCELNFSICLTCKLPEPEIRQGSFEIVSE